MSFAGSLPEGTPLTIIIDTDPDGDGLETAFDPLAFQDLLNAGR